jgi:GLPGLI family protein
MKYLFTTLILLCTILAVGQKPDSVLIRVRYTFVNNLDTSSAGKTRIENMLLFAGKDYSLYTSYDKINFEISLDQRIRAMLIARVDDGTKTFKVDQSGSQWMSKSTHYYFVKENKRYTKEKIAFQDYFFEDNTPAINWKIERDTLSFSGIICQKATTHFEGKNWVVWFAPALPFQTGPWKLNSLPGLIIEAYDENKTSHFQFAGLENAKSGDFLRSHDITKGPSAQPGLINTVDVMLGMDVAEAYFTNIIRRSPSNVVKTTKAQAEKLKVAYKKDPKGFSRAQSQ